MNRPYAPHDPQYGPATWAPTRPSGHRTDAHRRSLHGRIEPLACDRPAWWQFWKGTDHA